MKKMIVAILAVTLVFSLISCDAMLNVMDKMSNNVAGTEKKVVENTLKAAIPAKSTVTVNGGTKTFSQGEGEDAKTMFSVLDSTTNPGEKSTLKFGDGEDSFTIDVDKDKLEGVNAVIAPKDLSEVLNGLKSGSNSEIEEKLQQPASSEDQEAAKGTQKVLGAILDNFGLPEKSTAEEMETMTEEERKSAEAMNTALDTLDIILGKDDSDKKLTQADVVVLTALTNIIFNNGDDVLGSMHTLKKDDSGMEPEELEKLNKEKEEAGEKLTEAMLNEVVTLTDVVSVVPSEMASGILDVLTLLTSK